MDSRADSKRLVPVDVYLTGGHGRSQGAGYIWSANDAFRIRTEFRILGDFVGTLPKHCAQNQYLALPLVLSYDELMFGLEHGFFRVLSDSPRADYIAKSPEHAAAASDAFYAARDADCDAFAHEVCRAQEEQRRKRLAKLPPRELQKIKERRNGRSGTSVEASHSKKPSKKRARDHNDAGKNLPSDVPQPPRKAQKVGENGIFQRITTFFAGILSLFFAPTPVVPIVPPRIKHEEVCDEFALHEEDDDVLVQGAMREKAFQQARSSAAVITATGARPGERARSTFAVEVPPPRGVSPERLKMRAAVFRNLYKKGYYMSCGAKFGADFLAYAGEPLLYHAALSIIVVDADETISPHDVVALGRLGDSTKKRTVLAYIDGDPHGQHQIRYVGVQWEETLP